MCSAPARFLRFIFETRVLNAEIPVAPDRRQSAFWMPKRRLKDGLFRFERGLPVARRVNVPKDVANGRRVSLSPRAGLSERGNGSFI